MSNTAVIDLGYREDEVAQYEAGHAAIELINGHTPNSMGLKRNGAIWVGYCCPGTKIDPKLDSWAPKKAIAGVLAQAKFRAEDFFKSPCQIDDSTMYTSDLVGFLLTPPNDSRTCQITASACKDTSRKALVNLCGCYSPQDQGKFWACTCSLTEARIPGSKFNGLEPECVAEASSHIWATIKLLNEECAWRLIQSLAREVLKEKSDPEKRMNKSMIRGVFEQFSR